MKRFNTFASVWDAISDAPAEAMNLRLRGELPPSSIKSKGPRTRQ